LEVTTRNKEGEEAVGYLYASKKGHFCVGYGGDVAALAKDKKYLFREYSRPVRIKAKNMGSNLAKEEKDKEKDKPKEREREKEGEGEVLHEEVKRTRSFSISTKKDAPKSIAKSQSGFIQKEPKKAERIEMEMKGYNCLLMDMFISRPFFGSMACSTSAFRDHESFNTLDERWLTYKSGMRDPQFFFLNPRKRLMIGKTDNPIKITTRSAHAILIGEIS